MADSSVTFKDAAGATQTHDTRTNGSEHRPIVVIGEDGSEVAAVTDPANITGASTTGSQGSALNVNPNAIQKATFLSAHFNLVTGVLTANTPRPVLVLHHSAAATKTVRIRRIVGGVIQSTALAGRDELHVYRGTAAPTGGSGVTAQPAVPGSTAAETTATTLPTSITAATLVVAYFGGISAATASTGFSGAVVYDWQESGETMPLTLRAGSLDTLVISALSSAAKNYAVGLTVTFTEE